LAIPFPAYKHTFAAQNTPGGNILEERVFVLYLYVPLKGFKPLEFQAEMQKFCNSL
jgi:hypothetical protein